AKLAEAAWHEARHFGGHQLVCNVAQAIGNRFRQHWGSWEFILNSLDKYASCDPKERIAPNAWDPAWLRLLQEIGTIFEGTRPDPTNGAVYWGELTNITRPWFKENVIDKREEHPQTVSGPLCFWK